MEKKNIKIGLIGLGTVGSGVFKTLQNFDNIEVKAIAVRNINKKRNANNLLYQRDKLPSNSYI